MSFYSNTPVVFAGVSSVTATRGSKDPEVGTRMTFAGNDYAYIYNAGNSQVSPGYAVVPATGVTSPYSCTVSSIGATDTVVGMVRHATLTTGTYGWVLTKGYGSATLSATVAAGDYLTIGADGKLNTSVTFPGIAKALSAAVTGASCGVIFFGA